jgi:hypothetical protein
VKLEKHFRELFLKKGEDPEVWITELEERPVILEAMDSISSENQFMIHILSNLTSDYELQFAKIQRRVGDIDKPLTIEEIRGELNLRYERLNMRSSSNRKGKVFEENAFFSEHFKEKCQNSGQVGHKMFQCKNRGSHHGGNNSDSSGGIFVRISPWRK